MTTPTDLAEQLIAAVRAGDVDRARLLMDELAEHGEDAASAALAAAYRDEADQAALVFAVLPELPAWRN